MSELLPPIEIIEAFMMTSPAGKEGICVTVVSLGNSMSTSSTRWFPLPLPSQQDWLAAKPYAPVDPVLEPDLDEEIKKINRIAYFKATERDAEGNFK